MKISLIRIFAFVWVTFVTFLGCTFITGVAYATPPAGYNLIWSDEFNGTNLDTSKWDYRYLGQSFAPDLTTNAVSVSNGLLTFTVYTSNGSNYDGQISTEKSFNPRYGYAEASIQYFSSPAIDGAFWMQSPKVGNVGNPHTNGVEMDIVEDYWNNPTNSLVATTLHWDGYSTNEQSYGTGYRGSGVDNGFHTYAVEWAPNFQKYYIDGKYLWTVTNSPALDPAPPQAPVSQTNEYIILGSGVLSYQTPPPGGYGSLATSTTKMNVDYVRYYQFPSTNPPPAPDTVTATRGTNQITVQWAPTVSAISYNIKRSIVSGGPYTTIATGVAAPASPDTVAPTTYTDSNVAVGVTNYYVVSAVNAVGESANSAEVSATLLLVLNWDANTSTAGDQDGSGTWGGTSTNWLYNANNIGWSDHNIAAFGVNTTTNCVVTLANDVTPTGITFNSTVGTYAVAGTNAIWTTDNLNLIVNSNAVISAPITGSGGITNTVFGSLTLSGTNSYTGLATVNRGTINVLGDQSAAIGGWTLASGSNGVGMAVNFNSGSLIAVASTNTVSLHNTMTGSFANATLNVAGTVTGNGTLDVNRLGTLTLNSGANWTQNGGIFIRTTGSTSGGATLTVNTGATFNYTGSGAIGISPSSGGTGSARLTISGGTFVTSQGFQNSTAASTGTGATFTLTNGGTLVLSANIPQLTTGTATNTSISTGTGSVGGAIDTSVYSTTISNVISGSGSLTKLGAGTLTLTASNTCTGGTIVNNGILQLNGSLGTNTLTVANAATLAGTGTANGAVTVQNGGTLAAGNGGIGTLTINNNLTLNDGSFTASGIGKNGGILNNDLVSVLGTLTLGGTLTVTNTGTDALAAGDSFTLFTAGTFNGGFVNINLPALGAGLVWNTNNLAVNGTISVSNVNYTLTYIAGPNGTINGASPQTVNYGGSGSAVTAVANTGYHFVNWSDGSTANPRTDVNVTNNIAVTANFEINTYTLTYTADTNGTISGTSPQTVNYGGSGNAVTAVPNTGYSFVNWSDGSTANPRTDVNVANNITVTANFTSSSFTLTYTAGPNGAISGTSPQTVVYGGSGTAVTAVPNTNYSFVSWSDGSTANPRTDVNVTNNLAVTANFTNGLPAPWTTNVVGTVSAAVAANYSGKTFVLSGAGAGLSGKSDSFWFVNLPVTNSFTITALVTSQQANGTAPLAGVMIRQDTTANSLFAFMGLSPTNQAKWISRTSTHGNCSTTTFTGFAAPYWVRIVRDTNTFTGYVSADGSSWTQTVGVSITMATNALAGLVVSSGASGTLNTAAFDNVTITNNSGEVFFKSNLLLQASAQMESFSVGGGTANFTIIGTNDTSWQLQESNDLMTWSPLEIINLIGGNVGQAQDDDARPSRFFRLVPAP